METAQTPREMNQLFWVWLQGQEILPIRGTLRNRPLGYLGGKISWDPANGESLQVETGEIT
jgi:hypothetical protein